MMISSNLKNNGFIAFLILLILIISFLSYENARDYSELKEALKVEKLDLENELNRVIDNYSDVSEKNNQYSSQVKDELQKIVQLRDSIKNLEEADYKLISYYRKRIETLATENYSLFSKVDSLKQANDNLLSINDSVNEALILKETLNTELQYKNRHLDQEQRILREKIAVAEAIEISKLKVDAMKKRKSGSFTTTSRANRTDAFRIEFYLLENKVISSGNKPIHIQLTDDNFNVISPLKKVRLSNNKTIIYSDLLNVEYNNKQMSAISFINVDREKIKPDKYHINIFVNGVFSGKTTINLR